MYSVSINICMEIMVIHVFMRKINLILQSFLSDAFRSKFVGHIPARLPPTPKKQVPQKRCRVCFRNGKRKETKIYCPKCPGNPGLHAEPCFEIYHEMIAKRRPWMIT